MTIAALQVRKRRQTKQTFGHYVERCGLSPPVSVSVVAIIMKTRIQVGTDVAMIGIWDASRSEIFPGSKQNSSLSFLENEAIKGHLFFVLTGGDCGGSVDLYIDSNMPEESRKRSKQLGREFLLSVPSGKAVVGGVEDYGSKTPKITSPDSVISVPPGDFAVSCFRIEETEDDPSPYALLEKRVGREETKYFEKTNKLAMLIGFSTLLSFPFLGYFFGWKWALFASGFIFIASFHVMERMFKSSARYQSLSKQYEEALKESQQQGLPLFVFELRPILAHENIKGGSVVVQ